MIYPDTITVTGGTPQEGSAVTVAPASALTEALNGKPAGGLTCWDGS